MAVELKNELGRIVIEEDLVASIAGYAAVVYRAVEHHRHVQFELRFGADRKLYHPLLPIP